MQCPTCGSSLAAADDDDVCPDCGMDFKPAAPLSVPPLSPSPSSPSKPESAAFHTVALDAKTDAVEFASVESTSDMSAAAILTLQRNGAPTAHVFPIGQRVTLGCFDPSSGPVDVDLGPLPEAGYVSRHHAAIWREKNGTWKIMDLESRNGTYVRSGGGAFSRVGEEHALQDGDEIALGNARFFFRIGEPRA